MDSSLEIPPRCLVMTAEVFAAASRRAVVWVAGADCCCGAPVVEVIDECCGVVGKACVCVAVMALSTAAVADAEDDDAL